MEFRSTMILFSLSPSPKPCLSRSRSNLGMDKARAGSHKRKNDQPPIHLPKAKKRCKPRTYLEMLPNNVIENIIRFTSEKPRKLNWISYIVPPIAESLLRSNSEFAKYFRSLLVSMTVQNKITRTHEWTLLIKLNRRSRHKLTSLVSVVRETIEEIMLDICKHPESVKGAFEQSFPKLKRVSLQTYHGGAKLPLLDILRNQSETLQFLTLRKERLTDEDAKAITEFGRGLKGLDIAVWRVEPEACDIWVSLGENLEELSVQGNEIDIRSITRNCRNLSKLSFSKTSWFRHEEIEDLCRTLGGQLSHISLKFCRIDAFRLSRIASHFHRASIELEEHGGCKSAALYAIGARACRVNIGRKTLHGKMHDRHELQRQCGARCGNLVAMTVLKGTDEALLGAFFEDPKPLLLEFKCTSGRDRDVEFLFQLLARKVSSLQSFVFSGCLPSRPALQGIVISNISLNTISVKDRRPGSRCGETIDDENEEDFDMGVVAMIFLQCSKLKELSISCKAGRCRGSAIENIARDFMSARYRNVAVKICGHQYF